MDEEKGEAGLGSLLRFNEGGSESTFTRNWHHHLMTSPRVLALAMAALLLPASALACVPATKLEGSLSIPYCDPQADAGTCLPGGEAVFNALAALSGKGDGGN